MDEQEIRVLLIKYEKIKGYSSKLFDNEEWGKFNTFCIGYNLCKNEAEQWIKSYCEATRKDVRL